MVEGLLVAALSPVDAAESAQRGRLGGPVASADEGYLAKVARLTAAREYAKERVLSEYLLLPPDEARPAVAARGHPSWAEAGAGQRERPGDPPGGEDRS